FRAWGQILAPQIEICTIELPGRGKRLAEAPLTQLTEVIQTLGPLIQPYLTGPFSFLGHSLGGLIAFELAQWLQCRGSQPPVKLWISAARAPHLTSSDPPLHTQTDAGLLAELKRYGGTPTAVLSHPELMSLMLPTIRADFCILETYSYQPQPPLQSQLCAIWGEHDPIVSQADVAAWRSHTAQQFSLQAWPGDHFFVQHPQFVQYLAKQLQNELWHPHRSLDP
ncbi:MAG: alpha/beta fold hydrolase, partial [Cyanobacteria bacterium P01_H01_bin.121]